MPPKKAPVAPSKKTEQKKKEKVIEDKTFGLKNKKGAKQQKFIQQVEKQVKSGGQHPVAALTVDAKKLEKEKKEKEKKELAMLFKPVQTQKIEKGADPKSILCAFFKQGQCTKGDKCKFSHDLNIERKAEKRSLYCDVRDDDDKEKDTMDGWDDAKLKEVVEKKHGNEKRKPTTDIICKHFLEAVEKSKYGWFWQCPSGETCIYRHALPPGFVLKRDRKAMDKQREEISLEDLIERERAALGATQTRVTLESFVLWKKRKLMERKKAAADAEEKKRSDFKAGRQIGLSGREMFSFNPELAREMDDADDDGGEVVDYRAGADGDEEGIEYRELDLEALGIEATDVDGTGTVASDDRFKGSNGSATPGAAENGETSVPINENLFVDDDDDLEGLDEDVEALSVEDDDDDDDDD